jgi:serine/threonine-protein kinase
MRHARTTLPPRIPAVDLADTLIEPMPQGRGSSKRRGIFKSKAADNFDLNEPLLPPPHDSAPWDLHEQRQREARPVVSATAADFNAPLEVTSNRDNFDGASTMELSAEEGGQGRELPPTPALGRVGRYVLTLRMGAGGIGTVWAAHDPMLSRVVAIKTLPQRTSSDTHTRPEQDFLEEARAAARLSHPHIVTVYDAGVGPDGSYIVMELLRGKDLSQLLKAGWRPSPQHAASIIQRVAEAIDYAHGQGVIHRDIKPANIFMVDRSRPVVLDFGIAHSGVHNPATSNVLCSPFYAAPEQLAGDHGDRRTDVYAIGVVLYELLTGERPYAGRTLEEVTDAVNAARPYPIQRLRAGVSASLVGIAMRAMARDPDQRYRSAGALARALESWLQDHGLSTGSGSATTTHAESRATPSAARQRQRRLFALAAALGAAGLVVAWLAQTQAPATTGTVGSTGTQVLTEVADVASR